jgi:hypothetical protein
LTKVPFLSEKEGAEGALTPTAPEAGQLLRVKSFELLHSLFIDPLGTAIPRGSNFLKLYEFKKPIHQLVQHDGKEPF